MSSLLIVATPLHTYIFAQLHYHFDQMEKVCGAISLLQDHGILFVFLYLSKS